MLQVLQVVAFVEVIKLATAKGKTREARALKAWNDGERPIKTQDGFMVLASNKRDYYDVRELVDGTYECNCADYLYRHQLMCRHILLCRLQEEYDSDVAHDMALEVESLHVCQECTKARNGGPARFSAGTAIWCTYKRLIEPKDKPACECFGDRNQIVVF
jgi:hypothetical protein